VNSFSRLIPYVWPHRRKAYLSVVFAVLVAILWGVNLSVAFPVVKVLLQGQSLSKYVEQELESARTEIGQRTTSIKHLDTQIATMDGAVEVGEAIDNNAHVKLIRERSRHQEKLSDASRQVLVMERLRNYVIPWLPEDQFDMLAFILAILVVATVIKGILIFIQDVLVGSVVELTVIGIRKDCFRRVLALDYQTLSRQGTPELMSRFTYDMNQLVHGLSLLGGKVTREPLKALVCIVLAFCVNWQLTLLSLLFAPVAGLLFHRIGRRLRHASHRLMESMSRIYKQLEETFDAMKIVIAFNGASHHRRKFHRENREYYSKAMKIVRIDSLMSPATETLGLFAAFAALLPGAYLVLRGTNSIWGIQLAAKPMDIAELSVMYVLLAGTIDPLRKLSSVYAKLKRATAASERIFAMIDARPLVKETRHPKPMPRPTRTIEFQHVHFTYLGGDSDLAKRPAALEEVNLEIAVGEVVAVVGENGSGKSTLVNLLPRYFDADHGQVLVDGFDIRDASLTDLRNQIGVVTQETLLFDGTIEDNIRYGRPGASMQEVELAARQAHVMQFVEKMPEGLQTIVGERGGRLSGGQRQRIALARAILRNPSILILDEPTSAIDAQSEQLIHESLKTFVRGRTTFLITHSVSQSMLAFVNRIVLMDHGKLIATGPHQELIRNCPAYQRLFKSQTQQRTMSGRPGSGNSAVAETSTAGDEEASSGDAADNRRAASTSHLSKLSRVDSFEKQTSAASSENVTMEPSSPEGATGPHEEPRILPLRNATTRIPPTSGPTHAAG